MAKIYKNQTRLKLRLRTHIDLTDAQTVIIKYQKPSDATGFFTATIEDITEGIVYYEVQNASDIDEVGKWVFWAYVTFNDARVAPGDAVTVTIYTEGK